MKKKMYLRLFVLLMVLVSLGAEAQTVMDIHTGKVVAKTKDDYDYKAWEAWQNSEDSIEYVNCVTRAFNYLHADSLTQAQLLLEKALKLRPDAPGNNVLRHNIGKIFMARAQWKDAATLFSRILAEDPSNADVREDRATAYVQSSRYEPAIADYDYLIIQRPDEEYLRVMRAVLLHRVGKSYEALDEMDDFIAAHETNADAYLVRADIYLEIGNRGYARRDLDKAVALGIPKEEVLDLYQKLSAEK